jgi:hypothetical protein
MARNYNPKNIFALMTNMQFKLQTVSTTKNECVVNLRRPQCFEYHPQKKMGWPTGLLRHLHVFRAVPSCLKTLRQNRSIRGFSSRMLNGAFLTEQKWDPDQNRNHNQFTENGPPNRTAFELFV